MAKLEELPALLRSQAFKKVWYRVRILNPHLMSTPLQMMATYWGDLSPDSQLYMQHSFLGARAIFLLSPGKYDYFQNLSGNTETFWSAIETGIPEIQARAIVTMQDKQDWDTADFLGLNEPAEIPWTNSLRQQISPLVATFLKTPYASGDSYIREYKYPVARLCGIMNMPLPWAEEEMIYHIEKIRGLLNYQEVLGYRQNIERELRPTWSKQYSNSVCVYSGYYAPLLPNIRESQGTILLRAFDAFAYTLIHHIVHDLKYGVVLGGLPAGVSLQRTVISRTDIRRIRQCLDDEKIRSFMGSDLLVRYRVLAGEEVDEPADAQDRAIVQNPGPYTPIQPGPYISRYSSYPVSNSPQGWVFFVPQYSASPTYGLAFYARGINVSAVQEFSSPKILDNAVFRKKGRFIDPREGHRTPKVAYVTDEDLKYVSVYDIPKLKEKRAEKERRYNEILHSLRQGY